MPWAPWGWENFTKLKVDKQFALALRKNPKRGSIWINPEFAGAFGATNSEKNASTIESDRDSEDGSRVKMLKDAQGLILVIT